MDDCLYGRINKKLSFEPGFLLEGYDVFHGGSELGLVDFRQSV